MSSFKKVYSQQFNSKNINYANALNFIMKIYKKLEYIDYYKDYDTKLMMFLEEDYTKNEILFLKNGISELNQAKIFLDNYLPKSKQYFYDEIYNEYVKKTHELTLDRKRLTDEDFLIYLNTKSERQEKNEIELVNISKELLKAELLIFKTKIERFGYSVQFKNEDIVIIDPQNIDKNQKDNISKKDEQNIDSKLNNSLFWNVSKKGKQILYKVLKEKAPLIDIIDFINENTTTETKHLLVEEIVNIYQTTANEFMFYINENDIAEAIETNKHNLEYVFIYEGDKLKFQPWIKEINGFETVRNIKGFFKEEKEATLKLVYLNNLMIDYYDGFFAREIEGFENITHFRKICNGLIDNLKNVKGENSLSRNDNVNKKTVLDFDKVKEVYINKINKAEELAASTVDISLKQDLFAIEKNKISEKNHEKLIRSYLAETILKYQSIRNLYKASNEQFHFINSEAENKLTDEDRVDFIATVLSGYTINPEDESHELTEEYLKEIIYQLQNIDSIIYDTKLAELKFNHVKDKLNQLKKSKEITKENIQIQNIVINDDESGFKKATIEDYLEQFKDVIINNTYDLLVDALFQYFTTGSFPILDRKINFKRMNKKRLGWELKELYKSLKTDNLDVEYFRFAKDNINLFANEIIENERFLKSNFYKAFTTNPAK